MKIKFFVLGLVFAAHLFTVAPSGSTLEMAQRLSLQLESVPITMVLQMIAEQNNLNLVVSGEVEGEVTLRLDNVDVATALEAILTPHGYNYYLKDDVIVVKPISMDVVTELESKTITLRYIDPITAKKALESRRSPKGKIVILDKTTEDGRTSEEFQSNRLLITDLPV
ncbi:MAG: secretin and TonB N-terminal domain-containing protein, partial [Candidatus Zixiibacteriota bacterium]